MHNPGLVKTFLADGAIAARRIVKAGSAAGEVAQATAVTEALIGVCVQPGGAADGGRCDICLSGVAEVDYGGNVAVGDFLTSDADGKAVAVTRHTHTENTAGSYTQNAATAAAAARRSIGMAMVAGVSGDVGSVLLIPTHV